LISSRGSRAEVGIEDLAICNGVPMLSRFLGVSNTDLGLDCPIPQPGVAHHAELCEASFQQQRFDVSTVGPRRASPPNGLFPASAGAANKSATVDRSQDLARSDAPSWVDSHALIRVHLCAATPATSY